ncbi:MAG TPA: universal stress protein [Candidatus Limnocylindrales bacterium]
MRVLLGVDGSTSSDCAASLVANLAWPMGSIVEVLTAYPGTGSLFGIPGMVVAADVVQQTEDALEAEARRMVAGVSRRFDAPDISVETHVLRQRAATAILDRAAAGHADLIVLGSRGRGPFESAMLGSVCAEVIGSALQPVLVARTDRIDRIVLGVDGSKSASSATETVRHWPVLHKARVMVLSVADIDPQWNPWLQVDALQEAYREGKAKLHEQHETFARVAASALQKAGIQVEYEVLDGGPAHRLVEEAVHWNADLIVVGSRGQSGLERLLVGSVARSILYQSTSSVLIVPGSPVSSGVGNG